MQFFDIAKVKIDPALCSKLGFKHIFVDGDDVHVGSNFNENVKCIIISIGNDSLVLRHISNPRVIGAIVSGNKNLRKVIEKIAANNKIVFIMTSEITNTSQDQRIKKLKEARKTVGIAKALRARVSLISMAADSEQMLSFMQMIELAKFIGIEQEKAKSSISYMGAYYDR